MSTLWSHLVHDPNFISIHLDTLVLCEFLGIFNPIFPTWTAAILGIESLCSQSVTSGHRVSHYAVDLFCAFILSISAVQQEVPRKDVCLVNAGHNATKLSLMFCELSLKLDSSKN